MSARRLVNIKKLENVKKMENLPISQMRIKTAEESAIACVNEISISVVYLKDPHNVNTVTSKYLQLCESKYHILSRVMHIENFSS